MRRLTIICIGFFMIMPAYATWQLANPFQGTPAHKHVAPEVGDTSYPETYVSHPQYVVSLQKGFLKENVMRIAGKYHWKVQWIVPTHYRILSNAELSGSSFKMVMDQLIENYPVKVTYDDSNRTMMVYEGKKKA